MGEVVVFEPRQNEGLSCESKSTCSNDTEEYLDLADLDDFMEYDSRVKTWNEKKLRAIEQSIENCDLISIREICFNQGGLLNGI